MAENGGRKSWVMVNRAPVLTLWGAVVEDKQDLHEHIHTAD